MGFKEFYTDTSMLDVSSNIAPYLNSIIQSQQKAIGALKYLKGIDWKLVDEFKHLHQQIEARTLLVWGENDRTFPLALGKEMLDQFRSTAGFVTIENTSLVPHEEQPDEVIRALVNFVTI